MSARWASSRRICSSTSRNENAPLADRGTGGTKASGISDTPIALSTAWPARAKSQQSQRSTRPSCRPSRRRGPASRMWVRAKAKSRRGECPRCAPSRAGWSAQGRTRRLQGRGGGKGSTHCIHHDICTISTIQHHPGLLHCISPRATCRCGRASSRPHMDRERKHHCIQTKQLGRLSSIYMLLYKQNMS
jgi:hypothetical protein